MPASDTSCFETKSGPKTPEISGSVDHACRHVLKAGDLRSSFGVFQGNVGSVGIEAFETRWDFLWAKTMVGVLGGLEVEGGAAGERKGQTFAWLRNGARV